MRALMKFLVALALACAAAGCSSLGPGHLTQTQPSYMYDGTYDPNAIASVEWHW